MRPISDALLEISEDHFRDFRNIGLSNAREAFRRAINNIDIERVNEMISDVGETFLQIVKQNLESIEGSYFGMLQGKYPIHLVSEFSLPNELFTNTDNIECRIIRENGTWSFASLPNQPFFNLEFDLPKHIASVIRETSNPREIADHKRRQFSYIDITGKINGIFRMIRLTLDEDWLTRFLHGIQE